MVATLFAQAAAPAAAAGKYLGLEIADWLVLAVYLVAVTAIGIWSFKKVHNMSDYFMGGRRFGKVFMMFFAFGAGTSSEQAVSVVAGTWRAGLAGIWWQFLWLWATPFYWIVAPVMRRMRALTTSDFFEARYDSSTATLYSLFGIIMSITFIAGGLYGSGKMVNALTGGQLDQVTQQMDIEVPQMQWEAENRRFGRGILATVDVGLGQELAEEKLPDAWRAELVNKGERLSDDVRVSVVQPDQEWLITDHGEDHTYSVKAATIKTRGKGEEAKEEQVLHLYGSGWRLLAGYELAILAMTVMFVTYGLAGGLAAAIVTDFIQGILTITFSFLLLPFVFAKIGGFGSLHSQGDVKAGMFDLVASAEVAKLLGREPITIFFVCMLSLTALTGIVVQPHIMGVCGAGKTEFEGRFGFTFGNFIKRFCTVAWTFTGLACIVWYLGVGSPLKNSQQAEDQATYEALVQRVSPDYQNLPEEEQQRVGNIDKDFADELFGRAAYEILPTIAPGLVGLLLAALLAAIMSTSDAQMVVASGLFTENIYKRFLVRNRSQKHYLWVGRLSGLIIVLLALILQAGFTDVIDALKVIIKTPALLGISLWVGIVWRGWTPLAVWASALATAAAWAFVAYFPADIATIKSLHFMLNEDLSKVTDAWQMASFMSVGVITGFLISFITPRVKKEKLDHFYRLIHTPVRDGEHIEAPCMLPEDPLPPMPKWFSHPDIELPKPTLLGLGGFAVAWILVGLIVWMTQWLATTL